MLEFKPDTDIILQGPISSNVVNGTQVDTLDIANEYSKFWFVNKVIVSTWTDEVIPDKHRENKKITIIQSEKLIPHKNNMNLQLKSTKEALKLCDSKFSIKIRSDQLIYPHSFSMMKAFVDFYVDKINIEKIDGTVPLGYLFVNGIDANNPYLVQDHIFWGYTEDVKSLLSCDYLDQKILDLPPNGDMSYYEDKLNIPSWFGLTYMKQFDSRVQHHFENQHEYLHTISPSRDIAVSVYAELRDQIFKPFPKIDMLWLKRFPANNGHYPYDMYMRQDNYFYEEQVENTECKYDPEKGFSKYF
tara:strand:- start:2697 stop:3599 length:903 start_codon:yes stop_codon:yes gene_type:complete